MYKFDRTALVDEELLREPVHVVPERRVMLFDPFGTPEHPWIGFEAKGRDADVKIFLWDRNINSDLGIVELQLESFYEKTEIEVLIGPAIDFVQFQKDGTIAIISEHEGKRVFATYVESNHRRNYNDYYKHDPMRPTPLGSFF